jgi:cold shock CspA family protein
LIRRSRNQARKARVIRFDENRGRGRLRLETSGEILPFTYKQVNEEGFVTLHEGEAVSVRFHDDGGWTVEREDPDG